MFYRLYADVFRALPRPAADPATWEVPGLGEARREIAA
jgi:hypothetical protein